MSSRSKSALFNQPKLSGRSLHRKGRAKRNARKGDNSKPAALSLDGLVGNSGDMDIDLT